MQSRRRCGRTDTDFPVLVDVNVAAGGLLGGGAALFVGVVANWTAESEAVAVTPIEAVAFAGSVTAPVVESRLMDITAKSLKTP